MAHWVTPPAELSTDKATAIGELNYGTESRMFVFAYRDTNSQSYVEDSSIPAYNKLVGLTSDELGQFNDAKYIIIDGNDQLVNETTEVPLKYTRVGREENTGLRIASNGQIVGRLNVSDPHKEIIFKVRYQDPPRYAIETVYRAYSHVHYNRRLYRLNAGITLPFRSESGAPDPESWTDIGPYVPQYVAVPGYAMNTIYDPGAYTQHNNRLYQLTAKIRTYARAYTNNPDMTKWRLRDTDSDYIQEKHNPSLAYVPGTTYNAPAGVEIYTKYNNSVYKLNNTTTRPYKAPAYDGSSDVLLAPAIGSWTRVGPVVDEPYVPNNIYKLDDVVFHAGKIYTLKSVIPFTAVPDSPDLEFWNDVGVYGSGSDAVSERLFRIVINTQKSALIEFETKSGMGSIKIGEQLGDNTVRDVIASPDQLVTYEVLAKHIPPIGQPIDSIDGVFNYLPQGLTLQADGTMSGRALGPTGNYKFEVMAKNINGLAKSQIFDLRVVDGYESNTFSVTAPLSREIERDWYKMIADSSFNKLQLYRPSDPSYGLRSLPVITLKDNIKSVFANRDVQITAATNLLDAKITSRPITCRIGNMRYRTALDADGKQLYDILYKELIPLSVDVSFDMNAENEPKYVVNDLLQLKTTITSLLGSDDENLTNPLRAFTITAGSMYVDSLPLWQTNPLTDYNAKAGPMLCIPVAYVQPGQASVFISNAIETGVLKDMMVNSIVTIDALTLTLHSDPFNTQKRVLLKNV